VLTVYPLSRKLFFSPYFLLIFSAVLFSTLTDQVLQLQVERMISSKDGLSALIWLWGSLSVLSAVFFPLLTSLLCAYLLVDFKRPVHSVSENLPPESPSAVENEPVQEEPSDAIEPAPPVVLSKPEIDTYLKQSFELSVVETLRAWGKIYLWSFVFIFPGIIRYINYILTPFVVVFSQKYQNGEVDALEYSAKISKNFWWSIKLWLGLFFVIVPLLFYFVFGDYRLFTSHPLAATGVVFLETISELLFHYILLKLFIKFLNEHEVVAHGADV
jgi:hypothetical protein